MKLSKLCLGTVQLGMSYGINNKIGKPSLKESKSIIDIALSNNINVFDTAPEYGDSEKILGDNIKQDVIFVSKISPQNWSKPSKEIIKGIIDALSFTLDNLKIDKIPIYLFHRFNDMKERDGLILNELIKLKNQGKIGKIGVSIYNPDDALECLDIEGIEVIQIPFNLIDKRLINNGFLTKAKEKGVIVFARSVFLQGLFFKENIPDSLSKFVEYKIKLENICSKFKINMVELALRYVLSINEIDSVLVGVETKDQLMQNLEILNQGKLSQEIIEEISMIGSAPEKIVNPAMWIK